MNKRRALALAVVFLALLAVVALAAGGRPLAKRGGHGSGGLPQAFWDYTLTTILILTLIGAVVGLGLYVSLNAGGGGHRKKPTKQRQIRSILILLAVVGLVFLIGRHADLRHLLNLVGGSGGGKGRRARLTPHQFAFQWPEFIAVIGLLLVVVAALYVRARKNQTESRGDAERLAEALDESLDDLRDEPDLRKAIVAAYSRMETALGAAGFPRRAAEAPREYLERALRTLDTSAPAVRRLTDLFEWARFSHHEPEPAMRDEAIQALADVRDELRANAAAELE